MGDKFAFPWLKWSGRQWVSALFGAMSLVAIGMAAASIKLDYDLTRADLEQRAKAYAVSMATDVRWYVDVARQTLRRTAERIEPGSDDEAAPLLDALTELPEGVVVAVYDAEGNSRKYIGVEAGPVSISDRPYFQELRNGAEWVISSLIVDRVTGRKTFAIGLGLHRDGAFAGAAVAYAPMEVFSASWLSVGGEDANAFLVHRGGWLTARLPPIDSAVYESPMSDEFMRSFSGPQGAYWASRSPIDGVVRVLGYAQVASSPLIAVIGISPAQRLQAVWARAITTAAVLLPVLLTLGLLSLRIRRLVAQQERTSEKLARSLARNEELMLEIHHRIKNNLQSVLSLVRTQVKDPAIVGEIEPRIAAMIAVHEHIYRNVDFVETSAKDYIEHIAERIIYASTDHVRLTTDIADLDLPARQVMPLGQLVNEAIINAIKYGYPDGRPGHVSIGLRVDEGGMATLTIHNDGDPVPAKTSGSGFGTRLIAAFAMQLNGRVETVSGADGVTVRLTFPTQAAVQG